MVFVVYGLGFLESLRLLGILRSLGLYLVEGCYDCSVSTVARVFVFPFFSGSYGF